MTDYRLYFFDSADHIHRVADIEAKADEWAIAAARAMADGGRMELWQRARMVEAFPAQVEDGPLAGG